MSFPTLPRVRVDKIESYEPSGSLTEFSVYRLIMELSGEAWSLRKILGLLASDRCPCCITT